MARKRSPATAQKGRQAEAARTNEAPQEPPPLVPLAVLGVLILISWSLYFGDGPLQHLQRRMVAIQFLAAPDELFYMWCGGKAAYFSVLDRWPIVLLSLVVLGGAWLAGRVALVGLGVMKALDGIERQVFALGVGLNLLSLYALVVGLAGGLQNRWIFVLPLVLLLAGSALASRMRVPLESRAASVPAHRDQVWSRLWGDDDLRWLWLLVVAAPFVLIIVFGAMLPPWDYDVREYHLQAPKEWHQNGRIDFWPHNIYANMPLGSELTSLWAMALYGGADGWWWGAIAGKTVMACYSLVAAATLVGFGRRVHSLAAGALAAVLYLSIPWTAHTAITGFNEGPVALYAVLAVYALWLAERVGLTAYRWRLAVLGGFCAGSAVACKYPPLLFLVVPLGAWVFGGRWLETMWLETFGRGRWHGRETVPQHGLVNGATKGTEDSRGSDPAINRGANEEKPRERGSAISANDLRGGLPRWRVGLLESAVFFVAVLAGCGLWFGKNWVLTNNPTYPLLYSAFDGKTRTPEKHAQWQRVHSPQPDRDGDRFSPGSFFRELAWNGWRNLWASLALPPLIAVAWFARRQRQFLAAIALWAGFVFVSWWLLTHRLDRFLVLLSPLAALVAAIGVFAIQHQYWRIATVAFVAASAAVHFPLVALHPDNRYFAPLERLRRDDRELGDVGVRVEEAHRWLNAHAKPGEKVLLLGDAEPFDLEIGAVYNTCFDDCQFTRIFKDRTRAQRLAALRAENIAYLFVSWAHLTRYRRPGNYGYTSDYPYVGDIPNRELVHNELVGEQKLLTPIPLESDTSSGELFRVAGE